MEDIYSSKKLEKVCKGDINFRWLFQQQKVPNHNTIARFRSGKLEGCVEDLFLQFIIELEKNLNKKYKFITADTGYESEENYTYL